MELLSRYRPHLLAHILLVGTGLPACQSALAAPAPQAEVRYDVPAAPLADALTRFAEQSGISLPYDPTLVDGKRGRAVQGQMPTDLALSLLLEGTGLTAVQASDGNWSLQPAALTTGQTVELGSITIQGQGMGEATEHSRSYTTGRVSIGTKSPVSLKDTPQTVSVISQKLIEDRHITDLNEAMKRTPGITVRNVNFNTQEFVSRGFAIENVQIDGAAPMDIGTGLGTFYSDRQYDMAAYDHVEVLRGAAGLLGGSGDPGGIVNLVRKRPLDYYQLKLEASAGSWDNYRSQVDLTGPLGFDGKLRGRVVAAYTDRHYFTDYRSTERPFLYGIVEADVSDDTTLTLGGSYDEAHHNGTGDGLPRYSTGGDVKLPRHTWYTTSDAWSDGYTREVFAKLDHRFTDAWKLNVSYTHSYNSADTDGVIPYGSVDETTNSGPYWWGSYVSSWSRQSVFDVNLSGTFEAFDREHDLLIGADYGKVTSQWRAARGKLGIGGTIDLWDPKATPLPTKATNHSFYRDYSPNAREQYGLYSTLRLQLTDPLKLVVGARAQRYKFEQAYQMRDRDGTGEWQPQDDVAYREPTTLVPFGGLIYALDDQWSTYASYSEVFKPQAQKRKGPPEHTGTLEPLVGKSYETGVKGELFNGALNVSAALFYTERENEALSDRAYPDPAFSYSSACCFLNQGKVVSKGIDLEATGEVLPGWDVMASYTLNLMKNGSENTLYSTVTPKHLLKLWSTYTLPGAWSKWRVGGGVTAQTASYVTGSAYRFDNQGNAIDVTPYDFSQSGYAIYDALLEYQVDDHWTVALNGNNLFDRTYYASVGTSEYGNYYGEPRNFTLTLRGVFD
ncbi:TonB-dependent siderophore receptor [Pseudomonas sp.]|uniref:TonB-dependent siderophore receptor n=1 Tax=Pseudomonas sp. TaxID=306 RepID=UPI0028A91638|nr:TonB-dependent siderophore receptor [Pseudomonas sp.]